MKYALGRIMAEEISYSMNRIKLDKDTKFEIKPQFSRTVRRVNENDKLWFVSLDALYYTRGEFHVCAIGRDGTQDEVSRHQQPGIHHLQER